MADPNVPHSEQYPEIVSCMAQALGFEFALIAIQSSDLKSLKSLCLYNDGKPGELTYGVEGTPCKIALQGDPYVIPADANTLYPNDKPLVQFGAESYAGARFFDPMTDRYGIIVGLSRNPIQDTDRIEKILSVVASGIQATRRAEAADLSRDRFIASISHEIRTPLTAIVGHAELIEDPMTPTSDHVDHLRTIANSGNKLLSIMNHFLDLAKIESETLPTVHSTIYPSQLAHDVIELARPTAARRNVKLELACESVVPQVATSDHDRLSQILNSLVGYAINAVPDNEGVVTLHIDHDPSTRALIFTVSDNGPVIPTHVVETIFEPFKQIDDEQAHSTTGTGLGLATCSKLARLLDGTIELESTSGEGNTFTLRVDTGTDTSEEAITTDRPDLIFSADAFKGLSILLVDDILDNRLLFSLFLSRVGASVITAEDGELALELIHENNSFDLIIMDMQMPVMDGYSATRAIRSLGINTPILALTAHAGESDKQQCLSAGCTEYLAKPTPRSVFIQTCARLTNCAIN
jgi:signal transduction histidine kinase/CheY-like chemotaxis protein